MQNAKLFFFIYYTVIPSECNERGTAAIKPRAESSLFELCRGVAVKTEGQSPSFILITIMEIATSLWLSQ